MSGVGTADLREVAGAVSVSIQTDRVVEPHRTASARWYAVHTLPNREFGALSQLSFQGFEGFLPVHWKTVRHARKFRSVKAPFFPRYLFVRLDLSRHQWRSVNGTFGVRSLVMEGEQPKPVPAGIVEYLMGISDSGVLSFTPALEPGQSVRVLSGPFANLVGELQRVDSQNRVLVLLDILGSRTAVTTSGDFIAPVV